MSKLKRFNGIKAAAELLNGLDSNLSEQILSNLHKISPVLAQKIQNSMFTFEDLIHVDSREMQSFIREIPSKTLVLALRKTSPELKTFILQNMSKTAAKLIEEDIANQPPQRLSEVLAAQGYIMEQARVLEGSGRILLKRNKV